MPFHGHTLQTESKMLQLISLILVICGCGLLMVLDWFIPILSSNFRTKSTLILLPLFRLQKGKAQSKCSRISMEDLTWFASVTRLLPNHTLTIVSSFNPVVKANNKICFILVRLVYANWSVADMNLFFAVLIPSRVVNDGIDRLPRQDLKWGV